MMESKQKPYAEAQFTAMKLLVRVCCFLLRAFRDRGEALCADIRAAILLVLKYPAAASHIDKSIAEAVKAVAKEDGIEAARQKVLTGGHTVAQAISASAGPQGPGPSMIVSEDEARSQISSLPIDPKSALGPLFVAEGASAPSEKRKASQPEAKVEGVRPPAAKRPRKELAVEAAPAAAAAAAGAPSDETDVQMAPEPVPAPAPSVAADVASLPPLSLPAVVPPSAAAPMETSAAPASGAAIAPSPPPAAAAVAPLPPFSLPAVVPPSVAAAMNVEQMMGGSAPLIDLLPIDHTDSLHITDSLTQHQNQAQILAYMQAMREYILQLRETVNAQSKTIQDLCTQSAKQQRALAAIKSSICDF